MEIIDELVEKYGITEWEKLYLEGIRKIRGTSNPPEWLYKYSKRNMAGKIIYLDIGLINILVYQLENSHMAIVLIKKEKCIQ